MFGSVSVVVPVYRAEKYLCRCLDSLRNQTYRDLQIILVDDGSPDASGAICDSYAEKDRRIQVIHEKNQGVSSARNRGIDAATGVYLLFVDADDSVDSHYVEQLVRCIGEADADFGCCGYTAIEKDGHHRVSDYRSMPALTRENFIVRLFSGTGGTVCSKIFKTSIIREYFLSFCTDIRFCEDQFFSLHYYCHAEKFAFVDGFGYFYDRGTGVTADADPSRWRSQFDLWERMDAVLRKNGISHAVIRQCRRQKLSSALIGYTRSVLLTPGADLEEAMRDPLFRKAARSVPIRGKTALLYILPLKIQSVFLIKRLYARII